MDTDDNAKAQRGKDAIEGGGRKMEAEKFNAENAERRGEAQSGNRKAGRKIGRWGVEQQSNEGTKGAPNIELNLCSPSAFHWL